MAKNKTRTIFTCQNCGAQRPRWEGRCNDCGSWNSFVEELSNPEPTRGWAIGASSSVKGPSSVATLSLDQQVEAIRCDRLPTGFLELDRVLGGGLVSGSFVLLGGSPGIGKSTLLMQMAGGLAKQKAKVLYISAEESVAQTGSRAHRLGVFEKDVTIGSESNLAEILALARNQKPQVLIVDSIQSVFLPELSQAPGSVSQVRECAGQLMMLAKVENITVILIGHVTKDGNIAGPKVLEHMVDCVLSFEGDMAQQFRLLRSIKNRFGATHELGVFQMQGQGLKEVDNPSELFLEDNSGDKIGSAVFASQEGSRPLLCEIQALTVSSYLNTPRRTSLGIDIQRLHMLGAVAERHLGMKLGQADIFINVVGGLEVSEPAADAAVMASLISSYQNLKLPDKTAIFGEIGLTGEIRAVAFADSRVREAQKLGFEKFIIPKRNQKHLSELKLKPEQVIYVHDVGSLAKSLLGNATKPHRKTQKSPQLEA